MKKNEIMPFTVTCIDLKIITLRKQVQESQIPCDITYMQDLKFDKNNLFMKQKQTCRHRKQAYG